MDKMHQKMASTIYISHISAGSSRIHFKRSGIIGLQKTILALSVLAAIFKVFISWGHYMLYDPYGPLKLDEESIMKNRPDISMKELLYQDVLLESVHKQLGYYRMWATKDSSGKLFVTNKVKCDGFFSYNHTAGNSISVDRDIWDTRPSMCAGEIKNVDYATLPSVSVVIPFHNEPLSTLLRTIHSVLNRTPAQVLEEVILVDDKSGDHLKCIKEELEKAAFTLFKVRIIRNVIREGSTVARIIGAAYAVGDVISYLDSHVEVNKGWMEPLLVHLKKHPKAVVMSTLDIINAETFGIQRTFTGYHGGFSWNLEFRWKDIPEQTRKKRSKESDPVRSPIMPAGAFALGRQFYNDVGLLDPHMKIWGVDDVEFSFRVWQCGGTIEIITCSRVAHIFRKRIPYSFQTSASEVVFHNAVRAAEVTMDDYKKFFYAQARHVKVNVNITSLHTRLELKKNMQCKDFRWFMDNIIPEMPLPPQDAVYYEHVKHVETDKCLTFRKNVFAIHNCVGLKRDQFFYVNKDKHLKLIEDERCIVVKDNKLSFISCENLSPNIIQSWSVKDTRIKAGEDVCLTVNKDETVEMDKCSDNSSKQKWNFRYHFKWDNKLSYL